MKDTTRWAKETLGLTIKSAWDIIHFASFDAERQQNKRRKAGSHQRTPGLDMMGYVVRRTYTIIRDRNFVKLRRAILRAQRDLDALGYVPWWRAQRIMSQWGEIKHSDSRGFCQKYNVYKIIRAAKRSVSWHLSKEMCQLLKAWRKECEWDRAQTANETVDEDDYLFRQPNGKPMNPCTFTYRFKLILKANNLPQDLNVHSLRHTNASLLIAQEVAVRTVASLLGHAQASTTLDIYAHAFDKNKRKAQEKLGKAIGL